MVSVYIDIRINVYTNKLCNHLNMSIIILCLQIFHEGKLSHFVDGRGAAGNWLSFVNCARYAQEQNLLAVQVGTTNYVIVITYLFLFPSRLSSIFISSGDIPYKYEYEYTGMLRQKPYS